MKCNPVLRSSDKLNLLFPHVWRRFASPGPREQLGLLAAGSGSASVWCFKAAQQQKQREETAVHECSSSWTERGADRRQHSAVEPPLGALALIV